MTLYKNKNLLKLAIILSVFFGFFLGFNNGSAFATTQSFSFNSSTQPSQNEQFQLSFTPVYFDFYCSDFSDGNVNYLRLSFVRTSGYPSNQSVSLACSRDYVANSLAKATRVYVPSGYPVKFFSLEGGATFNLIFSDETGSGGIVPSGSLSVTENGSFDVTDYAQVVVDVPQDITEVVEDPISNDFQKVFFAIVENIIPAFGILLVVWFGIDMLSSLIFGRGR